MTRGNKIRKLPTGIRGLDEVLGGGLPEFSFNLIAGGPGCGKTTMAHQFMFANATEERKAIYFTIFGEPPIKMLRYQQQFEFFDSSKLSSAIRFVHLGKEMLEGGLGRVLERMTRELEEADARTVIVDSFRSVARIGPVRDEPASLDQFVQLLALTLTSYEATTFLVGEYVEQETNSDPVFTVADCILWLHHNLDRDSVVRRLQVVKVRGQEQIPGLHTYKLSDRGIRVFPRTSKWDLDRKLIPEKNGAETRKTGIVELDEMLGGGVPSGYSMLVVGPSGSGKTTLATQFIIEGVEQGETAVIAIFEKRPEEYLGTHSLGEKLQGFVDKDKVSIVYIRPLDLSVEETLEELKEVVARTGAKRVVIDSLLGFELALAPGFRDDLRQPLYRTVGALTALGVTVMTTVEVTDSFIEFRLGPDGISFLADGILLQRYVEMDGMMKKVMTTIKMRGRQHKKEFREYEVTDAGIVVKGVLATHRGILVGVPVPVERSGSNSARE